jgi:tetratricopeptide (TPR) repeat protein
LTCFIGLGLILSVCGWAYSLGSTAAWQFDDEPNLQGLSNVTDFRSGIEFTFSGIAGPTGRPISLATFALQADSWPDHPERFRAVNAGIHLVNITLIFVLAFSLTRLFHPDDGRSAWLALTVAALWGLSPFLAPSSFMVIQRMTLLSGLFVLAGLILYLAGRLAVDRQPKRGVFMMTTGIVICGALAVFSKENGVLLPPLALVIEWVFLRRRLPYASRKLQNFLVFLLALPTFAVILFLLQRTVSQAGYFLRDFTMTERLLTQPRVLWDYLANILMPRQSEASPFTDNYLISQGLFYPTATILSILALFLVVGIAIGFRRRLPIFMFAVAWFLVAHMLESTVINLEIYFAHRNYLAAFGIFYAIVYAVFFSNILKPARGPLIAGLGLYVILSALVLADTARLWGDPELSAEVWYLNDEDSSRAAQFLASIYEGQNDPAAADRVIQTTMQLNPDNVWLALRSLDYCAIGEDLYLSRLENAEQNLREATAISFFDSKALFYLAANRLASETCPHLTAERFLPLIAAAERDIGSRAVDETRHRLNYARAWYHQTVGEPLKAIESYRRAFEIHPDAESLVIIAQLFWDIGEKERAFETLKAQPNAPRERRFAEPAWSERISEFIGILETRQAQECKETPNSVACISPRL